MWIISATSLAIIMICCTAGVFAPKHVFADSALQRLGMIGVALFCLPRFLQLLHTQTLTSSCMPADAQLMGHVGLALYCVGTAFKVIRFHWARSGPALRSQ